MSLWRCDFCGQEFEDDGYHEGDNCNACEEGVVGEVFEVDKDEEDY
jgi:ribosomal protein L37AE/L43A